jgi:hypothetical protein
VVELGDSSASVFVAKSGDAQVYTSDFGGEVKTGDLLGPSVINGVAQKLDASQSAKAVGVALADFSSSAASSQDVDGRQVLIGMIPVRLLFGNVAQEASQQESVIEKVASAVAGEQVSTVRIVIAGIIVIASLAVSGFMLFGSIKGSFDSVGRNPLASDSIFASLSHVTFVASAVLIVGLVVAYLVVAI